MFEPFGCEVYSGVGDYGYKFNSVAPGAVTISLTTAAQAANFAKGNKALLYGYPTQDAGFPPNVRYWDWLVSRVGSDFTV